MVSAKARKSGYVTPTLVKMQIVGNRFASKVFTEPGGPIMTMLWSVYPNLNDGNKSHLQVKGNYLALVQRKPMVNAMSIYPYFTQV